MLERLREIWKSDWQPIGKAAVIAWLVAYALFLLYALADKSGFLFLDHANLVVHEGGHLLVSWAGNQTFTVWGGTLLQWAVPLMLAAWFYVQRQPAGFAFCMFVFFENLLYSAVYMADARAMTLPLVTVGDAEDGGHDWNYIFSRLGLLAYDTRIGALTRALGWIGMVGVVGWLGLRMKSSDA
jgi:hypothetical protein